MTDNATDGNVDARPADGNVDARPADGNVDARTNGGVFETAESTANGSVPGGVDVRWLRDVGDIALREYRIFARSRVPVGLAALFAVFAVGLVTFGGSQAGPRSYGAVVASLSELGSYLVPLAALAVGYDAVVGAEERGVLDVLFALPVSRGQVLVGKVAGRLVVLVGGLLVGLGAGGVATVRYVGLAGLGQYAAFVLAAALAGAAFLSITGLISTLAREQTHALGGALAAWVWFVLLHDLAALGLVSAFDLPSASLAAMVLANPVDVFRVLVLSTVHTSTGGFAAVLAKASLSVPVLVVGLLAWTVGPLLVAGYVIRWRGV
ncbi:MAG: ABC transporter permease [Haloferacaceae archaeon]